MGRINLELDTVEAQYAMNSLSAVLRFIEKYSEKTKVYHDRRASVEQLKNEIKRALKEQADIEDLREGLKVIES